MGKEVASQYFQSSGVCPQCEQPIHDVLPGGDDLVVLVLLLTFVLASYLGL